MEIVLLIFIFALPGIYVITKFGFYLFDPNDSFNPFDKLIEFYLVVIIPGFILKDEADAKNDCCDHMSTAMFSPDHRISIFLLIVLCMAAFIYASWRKQIASPILEIFVNVFLLVGLIINILLCFQINQPAFWVIGNVPLIFLFLRMLIKNHRLATHYLNTHELKDNGFIAICHRLNSLSIVKKVPLLLILMAPILLIFTSIMLLFGQQSDSLIRAFTETYYQGFSQLDHLCKNVECGSHYLCSVAANGHEKIVRSKRLGIRNNALIICNRQLLVSNAFEELIQEKFPRIHKIIRKNYNRIGNIVHRYYSIFNVKWISDIIYILMKPLEWFFVFTLYCFDKNPENRIERQYTNNTILIIKLDKNGRIDFH